MDHHLAPICKDLCSGQWRTEERDYLQKESKTRRSFITIIVHFGGRRSQLIVYTHEGGRQDWGLSAARSALFTNLQYIDDTLIFGRCDILQACEFKWNLNCFETWSGLRINYHKSSLTLIKRENIPSKFIVGIFGCVESEFPIMYLGILLDWVKSGNQIGIRLLRESTRDWTNEKGEPCPWEGNEYY